ncbi:hypothetical protein BC827DRAFT_124616 [Russula dissimulans]|nr:hypothetical protein BC827DRAFT_124616 [Russula dissimulans]
MEAALLAPFLRGFRVHLFDDLPEWLPDLLVVSQAVHQPLLELSEDPLSLLTLGLSFGWADIVALRGPLVVVSAQRVRPCKEVTQCTQKEMLSGCPSVSPQWRLKISKPLNPGFGQSRHLITEMVSRAQSSAVASRRALCLVSRLLGMYKKVLPSASFGWLAPT